MFIRQCALAAGLLLAVVVTDGAVAAPVASAPGVSTESDVELAQWGPRRRCWWETRRFRDHRGRWQTRRVQVCRRW
ncbi:MAG TPA: hypothetical protein VGN82_00470 [Bosea sp. (in: a-proteobacteria)]|uniref:hypothetical protein n=1 Tax=Bosea sp. (in: a-proteobacteria) TaxID=1871050 RepID=UPI002E1289AF|nr:hypothetical protein [Bosea sp. (in: a-proteobacteria)]